MVPGRVPKELAKLANLTTLYLHKNEGLQVPEGADMYDFGSPRAVGLDGQPEGAPLASDGDMYYDDREKVAAFQVCLN